MNRHTRLGVAIAAALCTPLAANAENAETAEIRAMLKAMQAEYEARIQALEDRLAEAEARSGTAPAPAAVATRNSRDSITSGNAFNPRISLILDGNYYHDDRDGGSGELLGMADGISHAHGHADEHGHGDGHGHGGAEQGFNLRSAELALSATVDPWFDANAYIVFSDDEVELEEAWLQTRMLPWGLRLRAGKFLSDIGYQNNQHPHAWDFVDQNLAYTNLIGDHGLQDTGVQLTWLPDWDAYTLFGVELLQGNQERLGAAVDEDTRDTLIGEFGLADEDVLGLAEREDGPRLVTAFFKYAPDLGYDHALQLGIWGAWFDQHQEAHEDPGLHTLAGDARLWGLDAVYKYASGGDHGQGDFKLQGEYLVANKDLSIAYHDSDPAVIGDGRDFTQDGLYLQGLYGIAPRWQAGLRYDVVGLTNEVVRPSGSATWEDSDRWSAVVTWAPSEFSLLRLQYSRADIRIDGISEESDYLYLQFIMSLGTHGAHKF